MICYSNEDYLFKDELEKRNTAFRDAITNTKTYRLAINIKKEKQENTKIFIGREIDRQLHEESDTKYITCEYTQSISFIINGNGGLYS